MRSFFQARVLERPFPSPWDLPNPRIKPGSPTLQADAFPSEPPGKLLDLRAGPKSNTRCSCKRKAGGDLRHSDRKKAMWRQRQKWCISTSRNTKNFWHPPEARRKAWTDSPLEPSEEAILPTSWFWTSGLQKHDRIHFCSFKPPSLWQVFTLTLENWHPWQLRCPS